MSQATREVKVAIAGATGTVGQRFICLLASHPYFRIVSLNASPRSAGKSYRDAVKWKQPVPIPKEILDMKVKTCDVDQFGDAEIVFSGLDSDVAGDVEEGLRKAEYAVFSNAGNFRRDPLVPLVVPLVNPSHFGIIPHQKETLGLNKGFIITNANCSTTGIVIPLHALEKAFGPLETIMVTTMQAISGAGYPGVSSLDILDNVVPYIAKEEEKIEWELGKILGGLSDNLKEFDHHSKHPMKVSAACNRVPVVDGHLECMSIRFARRPPPSPQQVKDALRAYYSEAQKLGCPSAPEQAVYVHEEADRPQPRLDRHFQNGAGVNVGRVRECKVLDIRMVVLSANTNIGAATSSIMNAEYAVAKGIV
ncbi:aspartate-semialdehyde dehydrogenase [Rhodotorula toruloides]|uniref:Aspartate-semialdehyde dehydrogenase n=1 Tax=Rhodotorula toruloides TaxID=5286 RepID=A0A511K9X4_RHOTO|nr:aspartate-semialdehyde dehydrogenase [Rhodotorula toruloides]